MLRIVSRVLWPLLTLALALVVTFLLNPQLQHSAASPAAHLFRSPIRTSPTPTAIPTPDGLFRSILGTPQFVADYQQHLPLVRRDFTPTPTLTPTPTPTPIIYGLAWFSTHDCRPRSDGSVKDFTASDLLAIGLVDCPLQQQPTVPQLTVIGQAWAAAQCAACACPGPNCP